MQKNAYTKRPAALGCIIYLISCNQATIMAAMEHFPLPSQTYTKQSPLVDERQSSLSDASKGEKTSPDHATHPQNNSSTPSQHLARSTGELITYAAQGLITPLQENMKTIDTVRFHTPIRYET